MRKFVQQRKTFEGESVTRPPTSQEFVQMRHEEIEDGSYQRFDGQDNIRVETEDGFGLVMVLKGGMWVGKSGMEAELQEQSETAFKDFVKAYPPEQPDKDSRHLVAQATGKTEFADKGLPWGRLVRTLWSLFWIKLTRRQHFAPWHAVGHPNESVRLSAHAANPKYKEAVTDFMQKTAWEHDQVSNVLRHLDRPAWEESNRHYRKLRDDGHLGHLDQGPNGIHSALATIVNLTVQPHKDPEDARLSWTSTNTWCYYEGAWAVFPYLKMMIKQEPGDIIFSRSAYLEHWVTKITKGERYCNTRFSKGNVQNPLDPWVKCPVPGCDNKPTGTVGALHYHVKKHAALTDDEVEAIITGIEDEASVFSVADARKIARWLRDRGVQRQARKPKGKVKK